MKHFVLKRFICLWNFILFVSISAWSVNIAMDTFQPPRHFQYRSRTAANLTIYLYYKEPFSSTKFWGISSFNNYFYNPPSLNFNGSTIKGTKFYAIYHLKNLYVDVKEFNIFPGEQSFEDAEEALTKARKVELIYNSANNTLSFPEINNSNRPELHLAMNAYYVLTYYLSQPPIDKYYKMWNYPIPVTIDFNGQNQYCYYDTGKLPQSRDINISTTVWTSYLDSVYKHEYGHHIYNSIFGILTTEYTVDYDDLRSCDEQTAVSEGFSFFLMSQGPFAPYLENDNPRNLNLNAAKSSDLQGNFASRSGESTIYSVAAALYELANISGTDRVIDIIKKHGTSNSSIFSNSTIFSGIDSAMNIGANGTMYWQKVWDDISSSEKTKTSANSHYDLSGNTLNYTQYLNLLGIVYCRGIISQVQLLSNDKTNSFSWGSQQNVKKLNIQTFNVSERENANIPVFPASFNVILTSAENSDLSGERNGLSANHYYGLKIQGGGHNYVSSKMETPQSLNLQYIEVKDTKIKKSFIKDLKCSGPGSYHSVLKDFYATYWNSGNWTTKNATKINGMDTVTIQNLNPDSVYAMRVIAKDLNGTNDLLLPEYQLPIARMKTLFDTNSLFFFQTSKKQITSLWISPGRSLQWDYNSALASSERTIEGYGYYNYLNKDHIAGKNLKINLSMDVGSIDEDASDNKSAEEREKDILEKVKEIGSKVLLKRDGSSLQASVAEVKRDKETENRFIVSYDFKNPGNDGKHLLEAMFDKEDENNKSASISLGRYTSHSYAVDTISPELSLFEKEKSCINMDGWQVYGKVNDPGTNPTGIGILATWTNLAGYIGFPAVGVLDQFQNVPLHYDISVKDFQLGKYDETAFNEYNNVYTSNFIFNPVNGYFQIDDKPITHAGRITLVATDKAGNPSPSKTITWGPESDITKDNEKADQFFWKRTDDKICMIPEVDPKNNKEIVRPKGPNDEYLQITANNHHPEIESISFKNAVNSRILESVKDNELIIKWKDPDDSSTGLKEYGLDLEKCMVYTGLDGIINEEDEYDLKGLNHRYLNYDESILSNGHFRVKVAAVDKIGSLIEKEEIFYLNLHKPDIAFNDFDTSSNELSGNISGDWLDSMKINVTARLLNDKGAVITSNKAESNPAKLLCDQGSITGGGSGEITFPPGSSQSASTYGDSQRTIEKYGMMLTPNDASTAEDIRLTFDSETGDFSYNLDSNLFPKQIEVIISATDNVCNQITKGVRFEISGRPFTVTNTTHQVDPNSGNGGTIIADMLNRDESGELEYYKYDPYRTQLFIDEETDENGIKKQKFISDEYFTFMPDANRALMAALAWWHMNFNSWYSACAYWANLSTFIRLLADEPDFMKEFQKQATSKYQDHAYYRLPYPIQEKLTTLRLKMFDYCGKESTTEFEVDINYPPDIKNLTFNENSIFDTALSILTATITDRGKNLSENGISMILNGEQVNSEDFSWSLDTGEFIFKPAIELIPGSYIASITAIDDKGNKSQSDIKFNYSKKAYPLLSIGNLDYNDVEGNLDGEINEGEKIYLNIELKNQSEGVAQFIKAELINQSRYIKGITESKSDYDDIKAYGSSFNSKVFEFLVNEVVFDKEDIDQVVVDLLLRVTYTVKKVDGFSIEYKTVDLPFNLTIIRLNPALSEFNIRLLENVKETSNPEFVIKGQWYARGCFLNTIKIDQYSGSKIIDQSLSIEIDRTTNTFTDTVILLPGDNRFVVTAVADNGVVRTAEVGVRLTSQVGITLDEIAETASPNVTVTGHAWTVNSKLESVEVYVNGGSMGNVPFDSDGRFSLPVTLNGGENIIRAVARDDQGKIAADEITVRMHGPLTIRWARANFRTTSTPIEACGSYQVEGDDIATIVTYINGAPNTHQVTIDRGRKTFCTTFDLQPGNNLLRAVGTTTSGVSSEAYSNIEYITGGTLSITLDPPIDPTYVTTATISGSFTLANADPYNIQIEVQDCESGVSYYTPTIDPIAHTFTTTITLHGPYIEPWFGPCQIGDPCPHNIIATITQSGNNEDDLTGITSLQSSIAGGVGTTSVYLCCGDSTGWIEGGFLLDSPSVHIVSLRYHMYYCSGADEWHDVTIYDEASETWHLDFDVTPEAPSRFYDVELTDNYGLTTICSGETTWCEWKEGDPIPFDPNKGKNKRPVRPNERNKRQPKRTVDGN